jgi:riboflavin biosynthesis pyrimidine reductase
VVSAGRRHAVTAPDWTARFAALVERKARQAARAHIPPLATDEAAAVEGLVPIANAWSERCFDGPFYVRPPGADRPATSLVFVESADGNTAAADPSSLGGGDADTHLIYEGLSRVAADAVLAGAETIRGGDILFSIWRPELVALRHALGKPRHPIQIVATLRGLAFEQTLLYNVPDLRVVVITVREVVERMREGLAARPWITPIAMEQPSEITEAFRQLRRLGIECVSCVGGRRIARALVDAGLAQDLYLTTSPRPGGEPNTPLFAAPPRTELVVRKHGTGADAGVVFRHLLICVGPHPHG